MAQLTQCDNCEKTTRDPFGWWTLDVGGVDLRLGHGEKPYTLCGLACVAEFAQKHRDEARDLLRPYSRYRSDDGR